MGDPTLIALAVALLLASTWFVLHHAKRGTSIFILFLSIAAFGFGSAAVALLPIDLSYAAASAGKTGDESSDVADNPTYVPWKATYWTTFVLAWLVLPVTRRSLLSGEFTLRRRLRDGCARSLRFVLLMSLGGLLSVIATAIYLKSARLVSIVLPVLMALGNTYGLLLASLLLGNGLVNVPKRFWREACPANELRRVRIVACGAEEELFESIMALEDVEDRIEEVCQTAVSLREGDGVMENENGEVALGAAGGRPSRCGGKARYCKVDEVTEFHKCLEDLVRRKNETVDLCSERRRRRGCAPRRQNSDEERDGNGEVNTMDVKYLVSLSGQLGRAQERASSAKLRWEHLMEHSRLYSALLENDVVGIGDGEGGGTGLLSAAQSAPRCCPKLRYSMQRLWVRYLRLPTYRCISLVTAVLSAFVLLSEVTLAAPFNLCPFSWTLLAFGKHSLESPATRVLFQIAALVPLLYMTACAYGALFQMSLLGPYCLRGDRQSGGAALAFNAQYLVRLQFPLGYNYLLMLKYDTATHCAFGSVMSDMSTIPFLGTSFSVYAPLLVLAVCLLTLCDFYPRMLRFLGVEHEDALLLGDDDELEAKVGEGLQLMRRDLGRQGGGTGTRKGVVGGAEGGADGAEEERSLSPRGGLGVV